MTWIKTVPPEEATGELAEIYREMEAKGAVVANVVEAYSIKPALFRAARAFSAAVTFGGSSLGRRREELIATVISAKLKCTY